MRTLLDMTELLAVLLAVLLVALLGVIKDKLLVLFDNGHLDVLMRVLLNASGCDYCCTTGYASGCAFRFSMGCVSAWLLVIA